MLKHVRDDAVRVTGKIMVKSSGQHDGADRAIARLRKWEKMQVTAAERTAVDRITAENAALATALQEALSYITKLERQNDELLAMVRELVRTSGDICHQTHQIDP